MLPYSRGIILDNTNNYGMVKTETVFGFRPTNHENYVNESFNSTDSLEWFFSKGQFSPRSLQVNENSEQEISRKLNIAANKKTEQRSKKKIKTNKHIDKPKRKGKGKVKKCLMNFIKKGRKNKRRSKLKGHKKYILPVLLGLLAAKSLLIPIALKALAFLSAKGLMMGFFSTVMASVLSLKGMFDHSHRYQNRKDDSRTQVEIIQVPAKSEDHVYYDDHYRRGDYVPLVMT